MLIITRRPGESFTVGEAVIHIRDAHGGRVSVGIEAPKHVQVLRDDAKQQQPKSVAAG